MAPISLKDKQILACTELYLRSNHEANLAGYLLGTITSLPRNGRTFYTIDWDQNSMNATVPQEYRHLVLSNINKTTTTFNLIKTARERYEVSTRNDDASTVPTPRAAPNASDLMRRMQVQRLVTTPAARRSGLREVDVVESDSDESEEESDDLVVEPIFDDEIIGATDEEDSGLEDNIEPSSGILDELIWQFESFECSNDNLRLESHKRIMYPDRTTLKFGVASSFRTPLEALQTVGGFDYETVKRLCRNSNDYIKSQVVPNDSNERVVYNQNFVDITVEETMRFFGIILRISLNPIDNGGYAAYFDANDIEIGIDENVTMKAPNTSGWASEIMSLKRFKIIRKAFHPEARSGREAGDKCYHVRHLIRQFKKAACNSFIPGTDMAFDEGGIGSRHRLNPVRMYNASKPQKFRVDFFLFSVTEADRYIIMHLDIYQGANSHNIDIEQEARCLGTTLKAVVNAVCQVGIAHDPRGSRVIALDNRYVW